MEGDCVEGRVADRAGGRTGDGSGASALGAVRGVLGAGCNTSVRSVLGSGDPESRALMGRGHRNLAASEAGARVDQKKLPMVNSNLLLGS
jgi:hypothetical protein